MGVIRVEPEPETKTTVCDSCGGVNSLVHGLVYEDEFAHGVYFVEWCDGEHPVRAAYLALGLGAFGEGTQPADRMAFGVEWRSIGMALTDKPVRDRPDLLGAFVPREDALQIPNLDELWHAVDHIIAEDARLAAVQQWLAERHA
jgi:hypothetical protein